jgi:hypothetical protein
MPAPERTGRPRTRPDADRRGRRADDRLGESLVAWSSAAPVALALVDREARVDWVNAAFERLTGFEAALVLGEPLPALLDGPLEPPWPLDGRTERRTLHARDGHELTCDVHAAPAGNDRWMLTLVDRGPSRALEREVERLQSLLEFVQDSAHIGTWERDIRTQQGRWDRHMFRFWGVDPQAGTPSLVDATKATVPQDALLATLTGSHARPGRHTHRFRMLDTSGHVRRVRAHWEVRTTPDGTPDRVVGLMMDDTETYSLASSLDQAHAQLQLAVDLADLAVWRHDLVANRLFYNDRAFQILGLAPRAEGMSLDEIRALTHPDDVAEASACHLRALVSHGTEDMQVRYLRSDGTWRHVLTRRVTQRDSHGRALAFHGVSLDITEQVERSQRATELLRQLEQVAAASGIGVWRVTPDLQRTEWNAQMYALFEIPLDEPPPPLAEWVARCVHPDDRERMYHETRDWMRSSGLPKELAHRVLLADGRVRYVVERGRFEPPGGPYLITGVTIDVTERELALLALREATDRSALATRAAGIGVWEWNVVTDESTWDEQMYRLRGLQPRDGPAPPMEVMRNAVHPDDRAAIEQRLNLAREGPAVMTYEFRIVRPDGVVRWLASRSKTMRNERGQVVRRLGVNWDITEAHETAAARQERALALRESQAKSELLARMSHELRTPMNAVLGFTHLLLADDVEPGSTRHQRLEHIRSAGEHLLTLINNVLALSRLDGGDRPVAMQVVRLAALVQQTLPLVERLAEQHGVSIDAAPTALLVRADATWLKQVLLNLLTNAIKYNRHGGHVRIEAQAEADGAAVCLRVIDDGLGMTPEQLALAFEPFNRAGAERKDIEGTGIGLTIVQSLVARMGGRIEVHSVPDQGSTFEIRLDAARPVEPAAGVHARRILYIEDNPVNVLIVHELVRRRGDIEFDSAEDGASGVERAIRTVPGLVLIDMQLPDIEGLEVLRRLRAHPVTAALPCIALSANAMPEDIERALQAGFQAYWTKPLDFEVFRVAIDRLFGSGSGAGSGAR